MAQPQVVELTEAASATSARILVSLGFNCFSWKPTFADGPREMFWAHPDFAGGNERPSASGTPLLFPFPGRIGKAKYSFGGRDYELEPGDAFGNAIHGFVFNRPWRLVEHTASRAVGEYRASVDDPAILDRWPSDFLIRVAYELRGRELVKDVYYENTGDGPLPCGFGTHTYFRLPLADGAAAEDTLVYAPASRMWILKDMLATGEIMPVPDDLDLAHGKPLAGRQFDTAFTDLESNSNDRIETWLRDPTSGRTLTQTFDPVFTQCVVYTPPHREAICLEPYTCIPDAFRLQAEGYPTGLQNLQPGEARETQIVIRVSE